MQVKNDKLCECLFHKHSFFLFLDLIYNQQYMYIMYIMNHRYKIIVSYKYTISLPLTQNNNNNTIHNNNKNNNNLDYWTIQDVKIICSSQIKKCILYQVYKWQRIIIRYTHDWVEEMLLHGSERVVINKTFA